MKKLLPLVVALAAAGCASHAELKPGSSAADLERVMGSPAERINAGSETRLYYPRGRQVYVATVGQDGVLRSLDQRLSYTTFEKLQPHVTTANEARELLGPPRRVARMPRQERDVWEYPWQNYEELRILWAQFSYDGTLREVIEMRDNDAYPQSGPAKD